MNPFVCGTCPSKALTRRWSRQPHFVFCCIWLYKITSQDPIEHQRKDACYDQYSGQGRIFRRWRWPALFLSPHQNRDPPLYRDRSRSEWHRFKGAQTAAIEQLGELAEKARAEAGDEAAMLFETHQMMAEDLDYEEAISDHINNEKMNAEAAISDTAVQFAAMFESMDDSYMQARAADVRDVSDRILGILSGAVQGGIASDVPVLLAADDLAPSGNCAAG